MKHYVDIVYIMIINGVIISKNENIVGMRLKNIKGFGLSNVKKASGLLSNVKKANGLKSVRGSGLKILK